MNVEKNVNNMCNAVDKYTFENFIVDNDNEFQYKIAKKIAEYPGKYNPFIIFGKTGIGKTHLTEAIKNVYKEKILNVIDITAEELVDKFVWSIKNSFMVKFKTEFRGCDCLIVQDLEFLKDKKNTQDELFYTIDSLINNNKQVIFTCNSIEAINSFNARIVSRIIKGVQITLKEPNYQTRCSIINNLMKEKNVNISDNIIQLIAAKARNNVIQLKSALFKIIAYSEIENTEITIEKANELLMELFSVNIFDEDNINTNHCT
ncbi:hypothetical protein FACS189485_12420 [Spirochaetia bacterium]|nr:hypothetical protein FACS189485_12420 [Spirochaetia bacterium]